jgi:hypothetical protein
MCKCKKSKASNAVSKGTCSVNVIVNVTDIVKYVSLAGVAVVGIIFGTKCYRECSRQGKKEEK